MKSSWRVRLTERTGMENQSELRLQGLLPMNRQEHRNAPFPLTPALSPRRGRTEASAGGFKGAKRERSPGISSRQLLDLFSTEAPPAVPGEERGKSLSHHSPLTRSERIETL